MIAARAKKMANHSTNATPQPTEHRSTARRNSGVSQSQRKCPAESFSESNSLTFPLFSDFYQQPHREVHHHRPACTVWAINRRINKRAQFRKRRHHQSFLVRWSIRVKRARHARTMCTTRYDASATCPLTVHDDRSDHQLSHRVRFLRRRYCRRAERPRVLSPMHWYGISIHIRWMKQILNFVFVISSHRRIAICLPTSPDFIWIVKSLAMNRMKVRHHRFAPNAVLIRFDEMR